MITTKLIINGEYIDTPEHTTVFDPEDNYPVGDVAVASTSQVDLAFAHARESFIHWRNLPAHERMYKMELIAGALLERRNEIAAVLCSEIAKPLRDCIKEVERSAEYILFTNQAYRTLEGRILDGDKMPGYSSSQKTALVTYEPYGVVLAISPFNYPINLAITKLAPALVAGNTVVFKPASAGSISAYMMTEIFSKLLPPGVINFVTGKSSQIGDYMLTHKDVNIIAFTGSTEIGRHIQRIASVPVYLELGGKDAAIVLADADMEKTVSEIVKGAFSYSSQRCTAVKRIVVEDSVAEELVGRILTKVAQLKVGSAKENCDICPLINKNSVEYVMSLIADAKSKGGDVLCGNSTQGNIIFPTVIDHVTEEMKIYFEEPFGPALPIIRVESMEEAINVVNKSKYGLQSDVFTKDISKAMFIAKNLEVGTVQINGKSDRGPDNFPFPGIKDSGMGVAGLKDAILGVTRPKVIVINL